MNRRRSSKREREFAGRRGAAAVEFALCAPVLFLFFFAALEFSRANMLRQSVENAAYEGARRAVVPGATADDARAAASSVLNAVSAANATITVTPSVIRSDTTQVTVQVEVPLDDNSWIAPYFFKNSEVTGSLTLHREQFAATSVP